MSSWSAVVLAWLLPHLPLRKRPSLGVQRYRPSWCLATGLAVMASLFLNTVIGQGIDNGAERGQSETTHQIFF